MPHLSKDITNQIRILLSCITTGKGALKIFKDCIPFCAVSTCILNVLQNHILDFIAFQTSNFRILRELSVYDNLKRGQIIIKKGATAEVAKLTK